MTTGARPRSVENAPTDRVSLPRATPPRLIRNAIRCRICGDVIESRTRHDYRVCSCGNAMVDGGLDYERSGVRDGWDSIENLSEYTADA